MLVFHTSILLEMLHLLVELAVHNVHNVNKLNYMRKIKRHIIIDFKDLVIERLNPYWKGNNSYIKILFHLRIEII